MFSSSDTCPRSVFTHVRDVFLLAFILKTAREKDVGKSHYLATDFLFFVFLVS